MTLTGQQLQARAKNKRASIRRKRRDPRFLRAMGKLVAAKLLQTNIESIVPVHAPVELSDALWAGAIEPRIYELLPAILLKKPSLFVGTDALPKDVADTVYAIRHGQATQPFRQIPASSYLPWVERIGHKGVSPSLLKSFRMKQEDLALLRHLRDTLATSETDVIRRALRALEREHAPLDSKRTPSS